MTRELIFDFVPPDAGWLMEIAAPPGDMLVGRRTHEVGKRMNADMERRSAAKEEGTPFSVPVFGLPTRPPDPPDPGVRSQLVHRDRQPALAAAAGKNLEILGANVARQCLRRRALDEILVYLLPVLLGDASASRPRAYPGSTWARSAASRRRPRILRFRVRK